MDKILIIDDDMDMCLLLERFFRRNQYEVKTTHSGKKGLEEIEKNPPDAILCDFRLGDTDGKELLIQIKQLLHLSGAIPNMPILPIRLNIYWR